MRAIAEGLTRGVATTTEVVLFIVAQRNLYGLVIGDNRIGHVLIQGLGSTPLKIFCASVVNQAEPLKFRADTPRGYPC